MDNSHRTKIIAKNTLFLFFRMLVVLVVSLFTSRIVLKTLGVEDFGTYNVVGSVIVLFSFIQTALTNASYRFFTYDLGLNDPSKLNKTFSMSVNTHLILAFVVLVLSETIGLWFLNYKLVFPIERLSAANWAYQFSIFSFCINVIKTPYNSTIIAHEKMSFFALTSIIEAILKLVIVYILVIGSLDKLIIYSFLIFFITVVLLLWYWIYCIRFYTECRYKRHWDSTLLKQMLNYSGWSIVVNATDVGVTQSIVIFFNVFSGVIANAALGIANQVNGSINQFLQSFTQSFNPQIIKSYASNNREYFMKLIFSTSKLSYFLMFFISFPLMLNLNFILKLWLGNFPQETITFIYLTLLYSLIDAYSAPLWTAVHATGKLKTHQLLMSSIKILNIPLAYLALKFNLELFWALAIKAILNIICSIVRPIYMKRLINLPLTDYWLSVILRIVAVTILSIPIPLWIGSLYPDSWIRLFFTASSSTIVICLFIYFIGLNSSEINLLKSFIRKK